MQERISYLSLEALAATLGLPKRFLRARAERGDIPALRAGRLLRFDPLAVREALREYAEREGKHGDAQ